MTSSETELLGKTKNDISVYMDENSSHARTHIADTPGLMEYALEAIPQINATNDQEYTDVNLGRVLGETDLVETQDDDDIIYAIRVGRDTPARFVKNRQRVVTSYVSLILRKREAGGYYLFSTWLGEIVPPFPVGDHATIENKEYWKKHALVWGRQAIKEGTVTKEWPWNE